MPFHRIPASAVEAGRPASSHLAMTLRDNQLYKDYVRQLLQDDAATDGKLLNASLGHLHTSESTTTTYTLVDRVEILASVNDRLDFHFGGGGTAAATVAASLTPDVYMLDALAAHIQSQMRTAASGTTNITVTFDTTEGSPTRGLFVIRHTGTTDSPNARILKLLFASGANRARSVAPSIGFAAIDKLGAFGYAGTSGFRHGFTQDVILMGDGALMDSPGIQGSDLAAPYDTPAVTTGKLENSVVNAAALASSGGSEAIDTNNIAGGAITGTKSGAPSTEQANISAGGSHTFNISQPNGGSTRAPYVTAFVVGPSGPTSAAIQVFSPTHDSGDDWSVGVRNHAGSAYDVRIAWY